jgi:hypothetical protein
MDPGMQIPKVRFELLPVFPPRHTVNPRRGARANRPVRRLQTLNGHVVQERGEPHILVLARHLAHAVQIT